MGNDSSIRQFAVLASKKVQHDENKKKKGPSAEIPKEQMEGVINAIAIHGEPPARVARRVGVGINTLVFEIVDELLGRARRPKPPAFGMRPLRRAA